MSTSIVPQDGAENIGNSVAIAPQSFDFEDTAAAELQFDDYGVPALSASQFYNKHLLVLGAEFIDSPVYGQKGKTERKAIFTLLCAEDQDPVCVDHFDEAGNPIYRRLKMFGNRFLNAQAESMIELHQFPTRSTIVQIPMSKGFNPSYKLGPLSAIKSDVPFVPLDPSKISGEE